jgi:acyl-coenzyme A thioesterase PaaI-like protein
VTTDPGQDRIAALRAQNHPYCVVCGQANGHGLGLHFRSTAPKLVEGTFDCDRTFEGYPEMLHGGVISAILDGAMTNCLFAHGHVAVTVELNVRFRNPVVTGCVATIKAWIESSLPPIHVLVGEIEQDGQLVATAKGKFVDKSMLAWTRKKAL